MRALASMMMLFLAVQAIAAPRPARVTPEARTAAAFDRIADNPAALRLFLQAMPKGADLHNHLGGSTYAEDFLAWAAADGLCIATDTNRVVDPPCDAPNRIAAAALPGDYDRYSRVIDALSARGHEQGTGKPEVPGYDRFFSSFTAFGPIAGREPGKILAATREMAADDHVSYLELMTIPAGAGGLIGPAETADPSGIDFAAMAKAIDPLLPRAMAAARADMDRREAEVAAIQRCGTADPAPACRVTMRYLMPALRNLPPARVFAQLAFGFALVEADARFVGVNMVAPEHEPVPIRDYRLHMRMIAFLRQRHPTVPISLHAGELTLGLVPPRDLRFHIAEAVNIAGARRIGHGVDIAYEVDAPALLERMARERIAIEINLTSNAVILGVKGRDHPLSLYRAAGVPVTLSTDDEGVSRSDMTNEYVRAATEQHLRYRDLKRIARNGLEYAFVEGASLWKQGLSTERVDACASITLPGCAVFLAKSPKARLQWQLEQDFAAFEQAPPILGGQ
jgi:adenosine deaminase